MEQIKNLLKKILDPVIQRFIQHATHKITDQVIHLATPTIYNQIMHQAIPWISSQVIQQTVPQITDQVNQQAVQQITDQVSQQAIQQAADQIGQRALQRTIGLSPYTALLNPHGILNSSKDLDPTTKFAYTLYLAYRERAEIALHVAYAFIGGDYFEFGSDGMGTFRNFLTAFDLNALSPRFPDTHFYAFDIFGDMNNTPEGINENDVSYFKGYADSQKYQQALQYVANHDLYIDKCHVVRGFFQDTLNNALRTKLIENKRKIGFAFLDCNITSSYEVCLDFILDFLVGGSFVYMDEYFMNKEVPDIFLRYSARLLERHLRPIYVRNAGTFGALFLIIPA